HQPARRGYAGRRPAGRSRRAAALPPPPGAANRGLPGDFWLPRRRLRLRRSRAPLAAQHPPLRQAPAHLAAARPQLRLE
nr:hypothetical protein [Tanacetum cinerariifolium]